MGIQTQESRGREGDDLDIFPKTQCVGGVKNTNVKIPQGQQGRKFHIHTKSKGGSLPVRAQGLILQTQKRRKNQGSVRVRVCKRERERGREWSLRERTKT